MEYGGAWTSQYSRSTMRGVRSMMPWIVVLRERHWDESFGRDGHRVMLVGKK
jgi:hypothetical protein